jgi:hypothetical protein
LRRIIYSYLLPFTTNTELLYPWFKVNIMEPIRTDGEEDMLLATQWHPTQWISCVFDGLLMGKEGLATAVASLNTVRRRGKSNINIVELEEDTEEVE